MSGNFLYYRNVKPALTLTLRRVLLEKYRSWQLTGTNLYSTVTTAAGAHTSSSQMKGSSHFSQPGKVPSKPESSVTSDELTEDTSHKHLTQSTNELPEDTTRGLPPMPLKELTEGAPQEYASEPPEELTGNALQRQPPEPPEPGICCMTGCANCVWIKHVEELKDFYQDKGKDAARKALEQIPDENLKAFLKIELDLNK